MPYGVAKDIGGDTAANDAKMERCVAAVMKTGHGKVSAIRICKSAIQRSARSK
jgi:hypothetical protein